MKNEMVKASKFAIVSYFDCKTVENYESFPRVHITAEVAIDNGKIHHINTDDIKTAIEQAVKNAVGLRVDQKTEVK